MKKIVLATGGTGGHIFPALAAAEAFKEMYPDARIVFMGGLYGQEATLIPKAGYDFVGLPVRGVIGRGLKGIFAAFGMAAGVVQALLFLVRFKPDSVLGFGGYAAFAGVLAARVLGIPCAIHEQNAIPGKTNRILGQRVRRIYLSFPEVEGFPVKKTVWVGNPVRQNILESFADEMYDTRTAEQKQSFRLLVMGGSLGAKALNDAVLAGIHELADADVQVWHQTGPADYERIREAYQQLGVSHVRVEPFIADMTKAYKWADLAVCRAGGSSLAELLVVGLPAILVPFPFATHNHQWHNANYVAEQRGAVLMEQKEFSGPVGHVVLMKKILELLGSKEDRETMSRVCLGLAKPDAARKLAEGLANSFAE